MDRQCHCDDDDEGKNAAFRANAAAGDPFRSCKSRSEQRPSCFVATVRNSVEEALCPIPRCVQADREPQMPVRHRLKAKTRRDGDRTQSADPVFANVS